LFQVAEKKGDRGKLGGKPTPKKMIFRHIPTRKKVFMGGSWKGRGKKK